MFMQNKDGRHPSVFVPDGESFTLGRRSVDGARVPMLALRPRSTLALMALAGRPTRATARLGDRHAFEVVDRTDGLVGLDPASRDERIGGYPVSLLKGVIAALDEESPRPPKSVRLLLPRPQPSAERGCGCRHDPQVLDADAPASMQDASLPTASLVLRERADASALMRRFAATHVYREVRVPDFLQELRVYSLAVALGDVVVGRRATLTLDDDIVLAMADNVVLYQQARVVQRAPWLSLDVTGRMQGSVVHLIHRVTDVLNLDHAGLSAQLQFNNA